jgi:L-alanine-DL-glutamate epimerase-like enolase superfamily enzyme
MDLGIGLLRGIPGTLTAPLGFLEDMEKYAGHILQVQGGSVTADMVRHRKAYEIVNTAHPFTGIHITPKGMDILEEYIAQVREVIGWDVPLAIDHFGHVCVEDCIRFCRRMEPYNLAWAEDMVPWIYPDQLARLKASTTVPICTGEDIYLKEGFRTLLETDAVSVIHPDVLTCGGALEMKRIADMADEHGVAVAIHMAESPVGCMAALHAAAAMRHIMAMEIHSVDIPWWQDMVIGLPKPLIQDGFMTVPDAPGLGIEALNEEVLAAHVNPHMPEMWADTSAWDTEFSNDRIWS